MSNFIDFTDWTKPRAWRELAEKHTDISGTEYVVIGKESDDKDAPFELLKLSRYSLKYDANKLGVRTSIRDFDAKPAEMSRRTRDLGITRFITDKNTPIFVLEPGADVLRWMASREGVAETELVNIMRRGEIGRAVRRRDRRALKASKQEVEATVLANKEYIQRLESDLAQTKVDLNYSNDAHADMVKNLVRENERSGKVLDKSGSMASTLGKAQERGFKAVTNKPLPGSYGG